MTFLSSGRLWLIVLVVLLAAAYVVMQRQRREFALRFAGAEMFDSVAPDRPGFRRHVPAAVFLAALSVLVAAFAQPARQVRVPRERATVIVAIDVSLSMEATDVEPSRIAAAQTAANRFIDELPPTLNVGIVAFAGSASVLVSPTTDRLPAHNAINNLKLAESTAIGEAIFTSLDALLNAPGDGTEEPPPARIVLLSDGQTTVGRPDSMAVDAAVDAQVPVSTIAFGTAGGTITYDDPATAVIEDTPIPVPVMEDNLRVIANRSGGAFFTASSLDELEAVYNDIGSAVGYELVDREITDWFVGGALFLLALAASASLIWFQRIP
ncbi:MAG: VWA domain-containing protein [Acidimicrobiia bacterium]|nr:VWA domain-containing protein [Acidimicrobiia bacterium]